MPDRPDELLDVSDLTLDPNNARLHNERNLDLITRSLREIGAGRSILVDEDGMIIAGNATVQAAENAGIRRVRVVDAAGDELIAVRRTGMTEEEKTRMGLYDNRTAELAEWNPVVLEGLQADNLTADIFTPDDVAALLAMDDHFLDSAAGAAADIDRDQHEAEPVDDQRGLPDATVTIRVTAAQRDSIMGAVRRVQTKIPTLESTADALVVICEAYA